ncbi:hypothetical protein [Azospirillum isscasi]|uniref:Uncharacterized protein n=1 Tax=Azospirillum isscasi TaxID=3053926 RepID=A0ABU0WK87_9PROT|nr:hypothetical protein [Azospirillum isscasi]MDQ2104643.1 hypothetical protein [Azospirillum isscasi]
MASTVDTAVNAGALPRFYSRSLLNARAAAETKAASDPSTPAPAVSPAPLAPAVAQPPTPASVTQPRPFTPRSMLSGTNTATLAQAASDTASTTAATSMTSPAAAAAAYQKNAPSTTPPPSNTTVASGATGTEGGTPTAPIAPPATTQTATQVAPPTADALRPVTNGIYSTSTKATDEELARAQAITSALPVAKSGDYGYVASEVSAGDAETLIKASQRYIWNGTVAAPAGTQVGVPTRDTTPASESTHYLSFANNGREVSNFALELAGTGFDATTLEDKLKSGALQIDMQKWGGAGHVGEKAASLTLSGRRYNVADFGDGAAGLSLNVRTNMSEGNVGDTIAGTFGGYTAKDGVTLTIRSYDPSISVTGLKFTSY